MEIPVKRIFLCCVLCLFFNTIIAQAIQAEDEYHQWFDQLIGIENTGLYNGVVYIEAHRTLNAKGKFYPSQNFLKGTLHYDGQSYYNQDLKYDVFGDQLLLKVEDRLSGITLRLFSNKLEKFTIDGHHFVNVTTTSLDLEIIGFYEISMQNTQFTLLTKHQKKDYNRKDRSSVYHEFIDLKKQEVLQYNGNYQIIKNKKDVITLFPEYKKEIDSFYNLNKSLRSSDPHAFILAMMTHLTTLMPLQNKSITE